jgi:hypothetical protein
MEDRTVDLTIKITEAQSKALEGYPSMPISVDFYGILTGYYVYGTEVVEVTILPNGSVTAMELDQFDDQWVPYETL